MLAALSSIRMRRLYPDLERPYQTSAFTRYAAVALSVAMLWLLLALRVVHGIAFASLSALFSACTANIMPENKVSQGLSIYSLMHGAAMALGPSLGVTLYQAYGLGVALWTAFLCSAICCGVILCMKELNAGAVPPAAPFRFRWENILAVKALPFALVLLCTTFAFSFVNSFLLTFSNAVGPLEGVGLYFSIYAGILILIRLAAAKWLDRLSFGSILLVNCPALAAALLLLQLSAGRPGLWASAALLALGHGIMQTVAQVFCVKSIPQQKRGIAIATYYMAVNTGFAFGPLLAGLLVSAGQLPNLFYYCLAFAALPLLCMPLFQKQYFPQRHKGNMP